MAARGLLQNDQIAALDLALYANPAAEKLFLQDLYAALHAPGEIVVFEHYESCCPSFLKTLSDLAVRGSAPLSSRYIVNRDGILVDAGTALAPGAVSPSRPLREIPHLLFEQGPRRHGGQVRRKHGLGAGRRL